MPKAVAISRYTLPISMCAWPASAGSAVRPGIAVRNRDAASVSSWVRPV